MRILAFDLGRTTGWAVIEDGELRTGSYTAKGDDQASVFVDWASFVGDVVCNESPDAIAFEDVTFNRGRSYIPGMKALLFVEAAAWKLTCFGVDVNTLKKFARRNLPLGVSWCGSKEDMKGALTRIRGTKAISGMTEDEVDAAWTAIWLDETAIETPETASA